jgi:predicted 3-demethylubiquinone-9 3-methyltransferase (glyoxalase superfamily)
MKNLIRPCIWLDANATEAAEFYCSAFGDAEIVEANRFVVELLVAGQFLTLLNGGAESKPNSSISFFYLCHTDNEVTQIWNKLAAEGLILMRLDKYPWSEKYGFVEDKFGVSWQIMQGSIGGQKIVPALMFAQQQAGNAEKAISFYTNIFANSAIGSISRYEVGEPDVEGTIKHGQFTLNEQNFVAFDCSAPHQVTFSEGVSLIITCETQLEIEYYWEKLMEGGSGSMCGWLKDQFGVSWQVVPSLLGKLLADPTRSERVVNAFLKMRKFSIPELKAA